MTAGSTAAAPPTTRAASSCTPARSSPSATTARWASRSSSRARRRPATAASRSSSGPTPSCSRPTSIVISDVGNYALGVPTLTTSLRGMAACDVEVETLEGAVHSGMFGGPAPDALIALCRMIATLHDDEGDVAVKGLATMEYDGAAYDEAAYRTDAGVLDGVGLVGSGTIADRLYGKPSINVIGIDAPQVDGAANALIPKARARVSVRLAPGQEPDDAMQAVKAHLEAAAPWSVRVKVTAGDDRRGLPRQDRRPGLRGGDQGDGRRLRQGRRALRRGRLDPAGRRVPRRHPRRRDDPLGRGGAACARSTPPTRASTSASSSAARSPRPCSSRGWPPAERPAARRRIGLPTPKRASPVAPAAQLEAGPRRGAAPGTRARRRLSYTVRPLAGHARRGAERCPSWLKERDWKSRGRGNLPRGFESLPLRHFLPSSQPPQNRFRSLFTSRP